MSSSPARLSGAVGSCSPMYSTSKRARSQSEPMKTGLRMRWILRRAASMHQREQLAACPPADEGFRSRRARMLRKAAATAVPSAARRTTGSSTMRPPERWASIESERVERASGQGELVQWKTAESASDILLAVASDKLGNLRPEPSVNLAVALGVVRQESRRR